MFSKDWLITVVSAIMKLINGLKVRNMTLADRLLKEFEELSDERKVEVIDFLEFVRMKEKKEKEDLMEQIINDRIEVFKELAK